MDHSKARARRFAIYTRKSSEEGLEQDFNSLQAQREPAKRSSRARRARAGNSSRPRMTMVECRVALWSDRRYNGCSQTSVRVWPM
jgi:hypothetical protein